MSTFLVKIHNVDTFCRFQLHSVLSYPCQRWLREWLRSGVYVWKFV